ncbi:MAG TPA: hypothetical protein VFL42_04070, partial [Terriglobales bacterium]|nr:hypothetical protein [Terriglobales bacterium]
MAGNRHPFADIMEEQGQKQQFGAVTGEQDVAKPAIQFVARRVECVHGLYGDEGVFVNCMPMVIVADNKGVHELKFLEEHHQE